MRKTRHKDLSQMPVQEKPCRTCPFAGEDPVQLHPNAYTRYVENLLGKGQHFCHSVDNKKICRGGREIQLRFLCAMGFLEEPTDEAFAKEMKKEIKKEMRQTTDTKAQKLSKGLNLILSLNPLAEMNIHSEHIFVGDYNELVDLMTEEQREILIDLGWYEQDESWAFDG